MMGKELWVFVEQRDGRTGEVGLELLGKGRELADRLGGALAAVLFGEGVKDKAQMLIEHGADKVYVAESPLLAHYSPDPYTCLLAELARAHRPEIILLGATAIGRDLAPSVAGQLGTGLSADCIGLDIGDDGLLQQIVPVLGAGGMAVIVCPQKRPQMATVRPGVMRKLSPGPPRGIGGPTYSARQGTVERVDVKILPERLRTRAVEFQPIERAGRPIEQARVIVAGGTGVNTKEGWDMLHKLATLLGGEVGGTRPVMDEGWITEDQMIGSSGKTIRPHLYVAVAISGDAMHTVGTTDARHVVAINTDPKARMFQLSDYGIVGDYRDVIPRLIKELGG